MDDAPRGTGSADGITPWADYRDRRMDYLLFCERTRANDPFEALKIESMIKSMTHHWFPLRAASFLFVLAAFPLFGEESPSVPPPQRPSVQATETETQPASTPSPSGQTTLVQQVQASQSTLINSPANDAARYLAGLPVSS